MRNTYPDTRPSSSFPREFLCLFLSTVLIAAPALALPVRAQSASNTSSAFSFSLSAWLRTKRPDWFFSPYAHGPVALLQTGTTPNLNTMRNNAPQLPHAYTQGSLPPASYLNPVSINPPTLANIAAYFTQLTASHNPSGPIGFLPMQTPDPTRRRPCKACSIRRNENRMANAIQFPYTVTNPALGASSALPYLPFALIHQQQTVSASGLVDSGAMVNVLLYQIGLQLGLVWEQQTVPLKLTGNLARYDARAVLLTAEVGKFAPVRLAFAWTATDEAPLLLGQPNFFQEFDVCLFRSQWLFEVKPKP